MNVLAYIAGYIVNKLQLKLCTECYSLLKGDVEHSKSTDLIFITMKTIEGCTNGLCYPSQLLTDVIVNLENIFMRVIQAILPRNDLKSLLLNYLQPLSSSIIKKGSCHCTVEDLIVILISDSIMC